MTAPAMLIAPTSADGRIGPIFPLPRTPTSGPTAPAHSPPRKLATGALLAAVVWTTPTPVTLQVVDVGRFGWTHSGVPELQAGTLTESATAQAASRIRSDRDETVWVKQNSGLTWDQLGKVFGVSRRAVHMWANGARLNEQNAGRLRAVAAEISSIRAKIGSGVTAEDVRAALLQVGTDGVRAIDRLRTDVGPLGPTWGAPFGPERLIDASREPIPPPKRAGLLES